MSQVHNIELRPGKGGQMVRAAGTSATLISKGAPYRIHLTESKTSNLLLVLHLSGARLAALGTSAIVILKGAPTLCSCITLRRALRKALRRQRVLSILMPPASAATMRYSSQRVCSAVWPSSGFSGAGAAVYRWFVDQNVIAVYRSR